jgi:hypothetical protein
MARKIPVHTAAPNVTFEISSEQNLSLSEANHIANVFLQSLKVEYGEDVLPPESPLAFHFEISVDANGQIISPLPTRDEIQKHKGHWLAEFKTFFRVRPQ